MERIKERKDCYYKESGTDGHEAQQKLGPNPIIPGALIDSSYIIMPKCQVDTVCGICFPYAAQSQADAISHINLH